MLGKILDILDKTIERLVPNRSAQEKIKQEFRIKFLETALQDEESLRRFILEYEGRATEVPKSILWLRSLIRPVFTWMFGILGALWIVGYGLKKLPAPPEALMVWNSLTLGFWFGARHFEKKMKLE